MTDREGRQFASSRQEAIIRVLAGAGTVATAELATRFGVSMDTVRRDLVELEASGLLRRVHGGAVRPAPRARRFADRLGEDGAAKAVLAELAAALIAPGQVVAVGGGTTTLLVARALPPDLEVTVVTASPDVALALRDHALVEVDLLGGRLHRVSQTLVGADTVEQVRALRPDLCVLSACAVDRGAGVSLREREEAQVVRTMVERSARCVVVASADKLGAVSPYVAAPAARIDVLVTDAPRAELAGYAALGIELVTPERPSLQAPVALGA